MRRSLFRGDPSLADQRVNRVQGRVCVPYHAQLVFKLKTFSSFTAVHGWNAVGVLLL